MSKQLTVQEPEQVMTRQGVRYVPVYQIHNCPDWAVEMAGDQWGNHKTVKAGTSRERCLVFVQGDGFRGIVPPGDWIIDFAYNENDGTNDHTLWAAGKVA